MTHSGSEDILLHEGKRFETQMGVSKSAIGGGQSVVVFFRKGQPGTCLSATGGGQLMIHRLGPRLFERDCSCAKPILLSARISFAMSHTSPIEQAPEAKAFGFISSRNSPDLGGAANHSRQIGLSRKPRPAEKISSRSAPVAGKITPTFRWVSAADGHRVT